MNWYEAKSADDLKKIGNLNAVKKQINKDIKRITGKNRIDGFIKMGSNSWKGQYEKILSLKKIIKEFSEETKVKDNSEGFEYFKSEADKYIFYLLELSGEERMRQLKIYKSLYKNKKAAREWYTKIAKVIHPDICKSNKSSEAMSELISIYNNMVIDE